jgi:SAM-dependent methyltransferase
MARMWVRWLAALPIDLGQGRFRHTAAAKQLALRAVPRPRSGARALDLGCGDGFWSERLRELGYAVTAVDIPRQYPNEDADIPYAGVVYADANAPLPFPDASFDLVWCSEVIEHLNQPDAAIAEIRRVLRPGGTAIITTPNSFFWGHYLLRVFGMSHRDWQNTGHVQFFHYRDVRRRFPTARISGYFPYTLYKREVRSPWAVRWLSPSFIIVGNAP